MLVLFLLPGKLEEMQLSSPTAGAAAEEATTQPGHLAKLTFVAPEDAIAVVKDDYPLDAGKVA